MTPPNKPRDLWTDAEFIAAYGEDAKKSPWPLGLGDLQRPGWTGRIKTYLIWCRRCRVTACQGFTVAHPAGRGGRLECGYCRARFDNPFSSPRLVIFLFLLVMLTAILFGHP